MMTLNEIIGFMPQTLAHEILDDVWSEDRPLYKAVSAEVAGALKVRLLFFEKKPRSERNKVILDMLTRPRMEPAAGNLLRGWLLKSEAPMLTQFLDSLGIVHEKGVVESFPDSVADDTLKSAVNDLLAKFPKEKVIVYLNSFNAMNDANWTNLQQLLKDDANLQLI